MEPQHKHFLSSKVSILGLFSILTLILAIPLVLLLSQQKQNISSNADYQPPISSNPLDESQTNGYIAGYVYNDQNQNGDRDPEEKSIPGVTVNITQEGQTNITTNLQTDSSGYFIYRFSNAANGMTYVVKIIPPDGYKTIGANPVVYADLQKNKKQLKQFGLINSVSPSQFPTINATPTCMPRPACLDAIPRCLISEPVSGWCPRISSVPTITTQPSTVTRTPSPTHILELHGD